MTTKIDSVRKNYSTAMVLMTLLVLTVYLFQTGDVFAGVTAINEVFLRADTVDVEMPDGRVIQMWGFAQDSSFEAHDGTVTVPGPQITVNPSETNLIIRLENNLPEPVSIIIQGQTISGSPVTFQDGQGRDRIRSFTHETPGNNTEPVTYEWTDLRPGTFLYQSGSHPALQVQMGLYGCVKKDFSNTGGNQAYDGVEYDNDVVLVLSEIDPAIHDAVEADDYGLGKSITSTINYTPKYFLVTGQAYTSAQVPLSIGQVNDRVLLRLVNAGIKSHVPVLQNMRGSVIAEDGFAYNYPSDLCVFDMAPAKTKDVLIVPIEAADYTLYDHALGLTNDSVLGGGMAVKLEVTGAAPDEVYVRPATRPADIDKSGSVDYKDLMLFVKSWNARTNTKAESLADLNNDGLVDEKDSAIMLEGLSDTANKKKRPAGRSGNRTRSRVER